MREPRSDDFAVRRQHLADMSEKELKERFWMLAQEVVEPLLQLARTNTTPSIERSVLLRMGFDNSITQPIVKHALGKGLLGHGAGHCVWRYAKNNNLSIREAGEELAQGKGWEMLENYFGEDKA